MTLNIKIDDLKGRIRKTIFQNEFCQNYLLLIIIFHLLDTLQKETELIEACRSGDLIKLKRLHLIFQDLNRFFAGVSFIMI